MLKPKRTGAENAVSVLTKTESTGTRTPIGEIYINAVFYKISEYQVFHFDLGFCSLGVINVYNSQRNSSKQIPSVKGDSRLTVSFITFVMKETACLMESVKLLPLTASPTTIAENTSPVPER